MLTYISLIRQAT
uniref:Uncharacterized protein n=1 Tax=Anguilla anguilla TaxID=7936 RepID=A0A0E9PYF3_ANGAN